MKLLTIPASVLLLLALAFATLPWTITPFIFLPADMDLATAENPPIDGARFVQIEAVDSARLSGWWVPPRNDNPVLLLVHGRSGNISTRAEIARRLTTDGFGMLLFDYRGYGASNGEPSESHFSEDALSAYDWLIEHGTLPERIIVIGQSLGNAPASNLAAARSIAALILVSPFESLPGAAADRFPWAPIGLIPWQQNRFDVLSNLADVTAPVTLIASSGDRLVPIEHSRRVAGRLSHPHLFVEVSHQPHEGLLTYLAESGELTRVLLRSSSN